MPPIRPPEKTLPKWAIALKLRRVSIGKSQDKVALDSGVLNQTTVSELEGARYEIGNLTAGRLAGLARGLDWTLTELERELGVDFGLSNYTPPSPLDIKQPGFHPEPMYPSRLVAHYGTVGAGLNPMAHAEHFPEQKPFPNVPGLEGYRDEDLFLLDVVGDSMACEEVHKQIPEGSTAIFHARLEPVPNVSIVAVWLEKEQTGVLKLYTHDDGHVVLRSYNDHHKPIILSPDDRDYLQGVYLTHVAPVRHPKQMKFRK